MPTLRTLDQGFCEALGFDEWKGDPGFTCPFPRVADRRRSADGAAKSAAAPHGSVWGEMTLKACAVQIGVYVHRL